AARWRRARRSFRSSQKAFAQKPGRLVSRGGHGPGRDLQKLGSLGLGQSEDVAADDDLPLPFGQLGQLDKKIDLAVTARDVGGVTQRSEEHTSELQSHLNLVCRLLLE